MQATENNTEQTLQRILTAVERTHRKSWVEAASAILLSMATVASAWCAYQSKLWGGAQGARGGAADAELKQAAEKRLVAGEIRVAEATVFLKFLEAKMEGKDDLAEFLAARLQPPTRAALTAWWALNPLKSANAPRTPFQMPEYRQAPLEEARQHEQAAEEQRVAARQASHNSDTYILLTVVFASVLFFGGISGTFESRPLRRVVLGVAVTLFAVTFTVLVTMPISWS